MNVSSDSGQDVDLNLAPIIDCFTVLITYLLVSASMISLTVYDIGVSANGESVAQTQPQVPPLSLEVEIANAKNLAIRLSGGPQNLNLKYVIDPTKEGQSDLDSLGYKIEEIKKNWQDITEVSVTADEKISYKEIVGLIEKLKKTISKVYLAG